MVCALLYVEANENEKSNSADELIQMYLSKLIGENTTSPGGNMNTVRSTEEQHDVAQIAR
jgi:hypothetical protein